MSWNSAPALRVLSSLTFLDLQTIYLSSDACHWGFLFLRDHRMPAAPLVAATTKSVAICIMQCYCIGATAWIFLLRISCTAITDRTITRHGSCACVCPGYIMCSCFKSKISVRNVGNLLWFPKIGPAVPFLRTNIWPKYFFDNFFLIPKFPGLRFTGATTWMYVAQCVDFRDCTLCAYEIFFEV